MAWWNPFSWGKGKNNAADLLGEEMAADLASVVDKAKQSLIEATRSGIRPEDVAEGTVNIVVCILDNTISAERWQEEMGRGHDTFLDALVPALKHDVATLVVCITMDGQIVYRLSRLQEAPRFYNEDREYRHMKRRFSRADRTHLRDRVSESMAILHAEGLQWDNPEVARTVNLIVTVFTDGLDTRSPNTTPETLRKRADMSEERGNFTQLAMFIGALDDEFRTDLERNIIVNRDYSVTGLPYPRTPQERTAMISRYEHLLPEDLHRMDTETLLRWWFYEQGLANAVGELFTPGSDPRAIRHAVNQMSQVGYTVSMNAYAGPAGADDLELGANPHGVVSTPVIGADLSEAADENTFRFTER